MYKREIFHCLSLSQMAQTTSLLSLKNLPTCKHCFQYTPYLILSHQSVFFRFQLWYNQDCITFRITWQTWKHCQEYWVVHFCFKCTATTTNQQRYLLSYIIHVDNISVACLHHIIQTTSPVGLSHHFAENPNKCIAVPSM